MVLNSLLWRVLRLVALLCIGIVSARADLAADLARVSVEATGGIEAHRALRGLRAVGVTRVGEKEASFILYAQRPDRLRIESVGEKSSLVRGYDGVHAPWRKNDPLSPPRRLGRAEEQDFIVDAEFDSPLFDFENRRISLDYAGEASLEDGRRAQKLLAVLRHTELNTLYIDDETRLLVRRDRAKRANGRDVVIETHYSDFRRVAGVLLPFRILTVAEGRVLADARIESLDPNPELPADFFAPPVAGWPRR